MSDAKRTPAPSPIPKPQPDLDLPVLPGRGDRFVELLAQMRAFITEADGDASTVYASRTVEGVLGYTPEEMIGTGLNLVHPDDEGTVQVLGSGLAERGESNRCVVRVRHKTGEWRWLEVTCIAWYASPDGGYHTVSFNRDVTDMVRAQEALGESEERYRVVSEMSRDLITEATADGRPTYMSPGVEDIIGYPVNELMEMPAYAIIHPDDLERVRSLLEKAVSAEELVRIEEYRVHARDGSWLWFETTGQAYRRASGEVRFLAVSRNITERRREADNRRELEEQMQRSQKLEGLGVMAGGIAHDFNNLLTPILGEASLGLEELPADAPIRARLEKIAKAANRAAALTNQMLSYAGAGPLQIEPLDLSSLVQEMGELLASTVSGKTVLDFELGADLPPVEADAAQLSQVVVNLISNASEALPAGRGRIWVRTGAVDLDGPPPNALFAEQMANGKHVCFEVVDTGCGMEAETVQRIFDPFYSTKFTGRGLGLAVTAGIVRGHRGGIEIQSEPGSGTQIRVLFPASSRPTAKVAGGLVDREPWRATGTALVVDDEKGVRDLASEMLSRAGFSVLCAADGLDGIELFRRHASDIRIVLLDLTMPGASGVEIFQAIRQIRPDARVVVVSGYSEERAVAELAGSELAGFLKKPFLPETLLHCVRGALERDGARGRDQTTI